MKAKLIIIGSILSVSNAMAGIPVDSSGNKVTVDLGCLYYGTFSKSECGYTSKTVAPAPIVKKKVIKEAVKAKPVAVAKPAPVVIPTPVVIAPVIVAPVIVAPVVKEEKKEVAIVLNDNEEPVVKRIIKLDGVSFKTNSDVLNKSSYSRLNAAAAELIDNSEIRVLVAGHSDSLGNNKYNQKLSEKRAKAVKVYLENKGVSANRMVSKGYGEDQPIASNATRSGRAQNRRVELRVID